MIGCYRHVAIVQVCRSRPFRSCISCVRANYSILQSKMFSKFSLGEKAEALDEFGVWAPCVVKDKNKDRVLVEFPPWPKEFDRWLTDERQLRPTTVKNTSARKRSKQTISWKVSNILQIICSRIFNLTPFTQKNEMCLSLELFSKYFAITQVLIVYFIGVLLSNVLENALSIRLLMFMQNFSTKKLQV